MDGRAKILIVDDEPFNVDYLVQELENHNYTTINAESGPEALKRVVAEAPDLILLDIRMPEMDGYAVCECLKADEDTREIPVLFISALDETEDKVRAFTAGGVDYVTKPFQLEEVLARVETHLALRDLQKRLQEANRELSKRLEELASSNAELQARNEELDAFAHTVAHDLKNPLTSLIGYSSLLQKCYAEMSNEDLGRSLNLMARSGRKMTNIIEELLLLASVRKVEEVEMVPLDMAGVVAEVQGRLASLIEEYQAEIVLPEEWPWSLGYGPWVEEMWTNYVSNAIKYGGRPPRVELGMTQQADGFIRFWVRDNGAGLTPEEQARLFTPFTRLHQVRAEGHGLGLSIVQRIAEKLGGEVGVESQAGQGCVFFFSLEEAADPSEVRGNGQTSKGPE